VSGGDRREGEVRVRDGTGDGPPNTNSWIWPWMPTVDGAAKPLKPQS